MSKEEFLTTEVIVLKYHQSKENDRILTVLSYEFGKLSILARGLQKPEAKLRSIVQPMMRLQLSLTRGKQFHVLVGAILLDAYPATKKNYKKTLLINYFNDLLDHVLETETKEEGIYRLLDEVLSNTDDIETLNILFFFEWRLLQLLGYSVSLKECALCKKNMTYSPDIAFFSHSGELLCKYCQPNYEEACFKITTGEFTLLRYLLTCNMRQLVVLHISESQKKTIHQLLGIFYQPIIGYSLKSRDILLSVI